MSAQQQQQAPAAAAEIPKACGACGGKGHVDGGLYQILFTESQSGRIVKCRTCKGKGQCL